MMFCFRLNITIAISTSACWHTALSIFAKRRRGKSVGERVASA